MTKVEFVVDYMTYKKGETLTKSGEGERWEFWKLTPETIYGTKTKDVQKLIDQKILKVIK